METATQQESQQEQGRRPGARKIELHSGRVKRPVQQAVGSLLGAEIPILSEALRMANSRVWCEQPPPVGAKLLYCRPFPLQHVLGIVPSARLAFRIESTLIALPLTSLETLAKLFNLPVPQSPCL